jgi:hypothetical protein
MDDQQKKEGEAIRKLADDLYRERVLRARAMTGEDKLSSCAELERYAEGITLAGIRAQHPEADEVQLRRLLNERLRLRDRLEASSWTSKRPS